MLGLTHFHPRFGELFTHFVVGNGHGGLAPVAFATILTATAAAVFAYNGYNVPVFFSEESRGPSRGIAVAILWSLVITVAAELVPTTAVLMGALIALAALAARPSGATGQSPYKMPLWPLPPILALAALGYVAYEQPLNLLTITGIEVLVGLVWWALVVLPQRGKAWTLKQPALDIQEHVKQP